MQIGQVIPLIVDLLQDIVFFWVIILSLREVRNKQSLLVQALRHNIKHWQLLHLNLFGYVGDYKILVLTVLLQLNFTVIIEVLFKLLIMMFSKNVLNILRLIVIYSSSSASGYTHTSVCFLSGSVS